MKKQNLISLFIGITCAAILVIGICLSFATRTTMLPGGIVLICLSLATGMIMPNPLSFTGLIAGICMLLFPVWVTGLILIAVAITGGILNPVIWRRYA